MVGTLNTRLIISAFAYFGLKEKENAGSNPDVLRIIHTVFPRWKEDSSIAWCSCFINQVAIDAKAENTLHLKHPGMARSWLSVGEEIGLADLKPGDIVILSRGAKNSGKGHVGLFITRRSGKIYLLGGNQSNRVCIAAYAENRFVGGRRLKSTEVEPPEKIVLYEQEEETPTQPEPQEPQQEKEDPADYPRAAENGGCLAVLFPLIRKLQ